VASASQVRRRKGLVGTAGGQPPMPSRRAPVSRERRRRDRRVAHVAGGHAGRGRCSAASRPAREPIAAPSVSHRERAKHRGPDPLDECGIGAGPAHGAQAPRAMGGHKRTQSARWRSCGAARWGRRRDTVLEHGGARPGLAGGGSRPRWQRSGERACASSRPVRPGGRWSCPRQGGRTRARRADPRARSAAGRVTRWKGTAGSIGGGRGDGSISSCTRSCARPRPRQPTRAPGSDDRWPGGDTSRARGGARQGATTQHPSSPKPSGRGGGRAGASPTRRRGAAPESRPRRYGDPLEGSAGAGAAPSQRCSPGRPAGPARSKVAPGGPGTLGSGPLSTSRLPGRRRL